MACRCEANRFHMRMKLGLWVGSNRPSSAVDGWSGAEAVVFQGSEAMVYTEGNKSTFWKVPSSSKALPSRVPVLFSLLASTKCPGIEKSSSSNTVPTVYCSVKAGLLVLRIRLIYTR